MATTPGEQRSRQFAPGDRTPEPLKTMPEVEPGPQKILDAVVICPCTESTLARLANAITDIPVWTMLW